MPCNRKFLTIRFGAKHEPKFQYRGDILFLWKSVSWIWFGNGNVLLSGVRGLAAVVAALELSKTSKDRINTSAAFTLRTTTSSSTLLWWVSLDLKFFLHSSSGFWLFMVESHCPYARIVCLIRVRSRLSIFFVNVSGSDQCCLSPRI